MKKWKFFPIHEQYIEYKITWQYSEVFSKLRLFFPFPSSPSTLNGNGSKSWQSRLESKRFNEEKNQRRATNMIMHSPRQAFWGDIEDTQWRKAQQIQPMWLCIHPGRPFEETFGDTQWRKAKQMQPMWLCIFSCRRFEGPFENTQWGKGKKMQPMWFCVLWSK